MAIIYSYPPNNDLKSTDILLGTSTELINGKRKNQTKSFELGVLANFLTTLIAPVVGAQFVTYTGATTNVDLGAYSLATNNITVNGDILFDTLPPLSASAYNILTVNTATGIVERITDSITPTTATIGALINSATSATPNNTDFVATAESGGLLKKITWTNVKSFLKTYFDLIYPAISNVILKDSSPQVKIGGLTLGTNLANANDTWISFGTSVTNMAFYSTPAAAQLNLTLVNYGVSGSTSNNLASQYVNIPTWTNAYRLLSIEHGINDSAQAIPLSTYRNNIINCIANAKSKGWPDNRIILIGGNYCTNAPMITTLESYTNESLVIAQEQGVQFFDAYNYTKNNGGAALLYDGVHPSVAGGLVYARGLIASMQGGMEITNGLTIDNGLQVNGIINANKQITTLASVKTGNGPNNNPANTVIGDVIVPLSAGITCQFSTTGIIGRISPLEDFGGGNFGVGLRNYTENSSINMYVANITRGSQILAFKINSNGLIDAFFGINSPENISIGFNKNIQYVGAWTNKLNISESSGSTSLSNGYNAGTIDFNVSNGVTNASNIALKILNNKSLRAYSDLQVDGNLSLGFDKFLQYTGAYTNKIYPSNSSGAVDIRNGYATGTIDFSTSNGVTNALNLALRILTNGTADFYKSINSRQNINIDADKNIQYSGAWTSKLILSDTGTFSTSLYNGYATADINFYTSNGVTNAANLALKILNNRSLRAYSDLQVDGSAGIGTSGVVASAKLQVDSTTKGFLPPRMTTTEKNAIASPTSGLVVYDTTLNKLCVRGASAWETITSV